MFELVKTLAEEPAKRKKVLIFYIRVVLSSIVATKFYIHFFGNFTLLNVFDKEFFPQAFNFFVSGKVLIVGFLYLLCHFLLFEILSSIPPLVLSFFSRGKSNKMQFDNGILGGNLFFYGVIRRNKTTREVTMGKNFDEFYYELLDYEGSTTKDEVYNYKHSLLFEILSTYFIGTIVLYFFTPIDLPKILDWTLIIGLFFLAFFYLNICYLINLIERNSAELIGLLQTLKIEEIVNASLKQFKVEFIDNRKTPGIFFSKSITINSKTKLLIFYGTDLDLSSFHINDALKGAGQVDISEIILLANTPLTEKASNLIQENKQQLTVVKFTTEDDLRIQLMKNLYDR